MRPSEGTLNHPIKLLSKFVKLCQETSSTQHTHKTGLCWCLCFGELAAGGGLCSLHKGVSGHFCVQDIFVFELNLYTDPLCTYAYHEKKQRTTLSFTLKGMPPERQHLRGCLGQLAASKRGGAADKTQLHAVADYAEGASMQQIFGCSGRLQHITKEVQQASPGNTLDRILLSLCAKAYAPGRRRR